MHCFALLTLRSRLEDTELIDRTRVATQCLYQKLIYAAVSEMLGAVPHGRPRGHAAYRNGAWPRLLSSQAVNLDLRVPKLRTASYPLALSERRRRFDEALRAVVTEECVHGVSTRKVDDLVRTLGDETGTSSTRYQGFVRPWTMLIKGFIAVTSPRRPPLTFSVNMPNGPVFKGKLCPKQSWLPSVFA